MILGLVPWSSLFGLNIFADFHTWLTGLSISGFALFPNIISANFTAFGEWATLGNYLMVMIVLLLAIIAIKFICKVKFDEVIEGFVDGAKKVLPVAIMMVLAYTILVCCYNNGFMENLIAKAGDSMGSLNLAMASLFTIIGSITNVDLYYTAIGIFTPIVNVVTDEAMLQVLALAFQTLNINIWSYIFRCFLSNMAKIYLEIHIRTIYSNICSTIYSKLNINFQKGSFSLCRDIALPIINFHNKL